MWLAESCARSKNGSLFNPLKSNSSARFSILKNVERNVRGDVLMRMTTQIAELSLAQKNAGTGSLYNEGFGQAGKINHMKGLL